MAWVNYRTVIYPRNRLRLATDGVLYAIVLQYIFIYLDML
jgi:hypothetical protein